jgi:hypothetical protein
MGMYSSLTRALNTQYKGHIALSKSHPDPATREIFRSMAMYTQAHRQLLDLMQAQTREAELAGPGPNRRAILAMRRNTQRNLNDVIRNSHQLTSILQRGRVAHG